MPGPDDLLRTLLSHLDQILTESIQIADGTAIIRAKTTTRRVQCSGCGTVSRPRCALPTEDEITGSTCCLAAVNRITGADLVDYRTAGASPSID